MAGPTSSAITICSALSHGGIAHYSYALAEALQLEGTRSSVVMYDEPEYDLEGYPHQHETRRDLRLATSSTRRLTSPIQNVVGMLRAAQRCPLVHFQWSLGPRNDRLVWPSLRALGKRIVYTAHDVLPHEASILPRAHCLWIYQQADALIVHGDQLKRLLLETFPIPEHKVHVIAHGNYNFVADTPGSWTRESARRALGLAPTDRVVLFFGLIREYKGLDVLIDACRQIESRGLPDGQRVRLLIAGRSFGNYWEEAGIDAQLQAAGLTATTSLHLRHIPMLEVARFFLAADVVALPYRRGSQSGVLQLANSFAKPAVATRVGSLSEGAASDVTLFVEPNDSTQLAGALFELLADVQKADALGTRARAYAERELGWSGIAQQTQAVYASVL